MLQVDVFDFRYLVPLRNHNMSKATVVKNRGQISHFLPL